MENNATRARRRGMAAAITILLFTLRIDGAGALPTSPAPGTKLPWWRPAAARVDAAPTPSPSPTIPPACPPPVSFDYSTGTFCVDKNALLKGSASALKELEQLGKQVKEANKKFDELLKSCGDKCEVDVDDFEVGFKTTEQNASNDCQKDGQIVGEIDDTTSLSPGLLCKVRLGAAVRSRIDELLAAAQTKCGDSCSVSTEDVLFGFTDNATTCSATIMGTLKCCGKGNGKVCLQYILKGTRTCSPKS